MDIDNANAEHTTNIHQLQAGAEKAPEQVNTSQASLYITSC